MPSNIKRIGLGTTISVRPSTFTAGGSTVFVAVANIVEMMSGPDGSAADIDTHTLDDGNYETHAKGSVNPGTGTMVMAYEPNDTSGVLLAALLAQITPAPQWQFTMPARDGSTAHTETFSAHVMTMSREVPKNGLITRTVGIQATGNPGFTSST